MEFHLLVKLVVFVDNRVEWLTDVALTRLEEEILGQ